MIGPGAFMFGVLIPLAALALVVYGFWELARSRNGGGSVAGASGYEAPTGSARLILDERFARGDLDADEYVQRRALLDGTVPSPPTVMAGSPADFDVATGSGDSESEPVTADPDSHD